MKKGFFQIMVLILIALCGLYIISRFSFARNNEKLEKIATLEFQNVPSRWKRTDRFKDFVRLPYKENEIGNGLIFSWIYIFDSGDTAIINIELKRYKRFLRDESPLITYNNKWSYLFDSEKDIANILPKKHLGDKVYFENLKLSTQQDKYINSIDGLCMILTPTDLYSLLEKGFYNVLMRYEFYTEIAFYEPIAKLTDKGIIKPTKTAKIIFNDSSEILIIPNHAVDLEWQNYNKEK